jgi:hypothetical protein
MFPKDSGCSELGKLKLKLNLLLVRFEVFTAVTVKNSVFWDVTQCGSCRIRRFGGTSRHNHQSDKNIVFLHCVRRLLVTGNVVPT